MSTQKEDQEAFDLLWELFESSGAIDRLYYLSPSRMQHLTATPGFKAMKRRAYNKWISHLEQAAKIVASWPAWKRGGVGALNSGTREEKA